MTTDRRSQRMERTCRRCATVFEGAFNSTKCADCRTLVRAECAARFKERNPDYWRKWSRENQNRGTRLKTVWGLTEDDWLAMRDAQGGGCAICGAVGGWKANAGLLVVDHDHSTGAIRGLLCPSCNRGLGQFEDDPARLRSAIRYLSNATEITDLP